MCVSKLNAHTLQCVESSHKFLNIHKNNIPIEWFVYGVHTFLNQTHTLLDTKGEKVNLIINYLIINHEPI